MSDPQPNEIWVDRRPMTDNPAWRDRTRFRRILTVTDVNEIGVVTGLSQWQELVDGQWVEHATTRHSTISPDVIRRRFYRLDEAP